MVNSKLFKFFAGLLSGFMLLQLSAKVVFTVAADKPDGIYNAGETATLTISAEDDGKAAANLEIMCAFRGDDAAPAPQKLTLDAKGQAQVKCSLDHPGQLMCLIYLPEDDLGSTDFTEVHRSKFKKIYGVMFSPEKILPIRPMPADFNEFWDKEKAAMQKLPLDAVVLPVKSKTGFNAWSVCLKAPEGDFAYGYLTMPKNAKPGSLPICLKVFGAGTFKVFPLYHPNLAVFTLNPHSLPNGKSKAFYQKEKKRLQTLADGRRYVYYGETDRSKYYLVGMFRRDYRAIQFLTSLPEWNGRDFIVTGHSQGGAQTLACAGLEPRITMIYSYVPAYCDLGGYCGGRESGGPYRKRSTLKENREKILSAISYCDTANFARNIKNPKCVLATGFSDAVCISSSIYAAFNVIPAKDKKIFTNPDFTHLSKWPTEARYPGL